MTEELLELGMYVSGIEGGECRKAFDLAVNNLKSKLPPNTIETLKGLDVTIGDGLTGSGGQTFSDEHKIILDRKKCHMSLQETDDLLAGRGVINPGERTKILPDWKDTPWSCLIYELVHEIGHIINGSLDKKYSPTKYGQKADHEAFAEAFTYWIFDAPLSKEAKLGVERAVSSILSNRGEL